MKKMISASIALLVMEEPHVGPTVVTLILSAGALGTVLVGNVVVVVAAAAAPALAVVVVVGWAVVVVVGGVLGALLAVTFRSAFLTLLSTAVCWLCVRWFRSDCTLSVCLLPLPSSSTVGSTNPVPFRASVAWVWVTPGAA